jgi:putative glutamine amidotransferase
MPRKPLIGVTKPSSGDLPAFWAVCLALRLSGARPVRLTREPRDQIEVDGLLLGGGSDIHPTEFRGTPKPGYVYDLERQALELAWITRARALDLPVLGICRGAQLMNVAAGGALLMDLAGTFTARGYPDHWFRQAYFRKHIAIVPGTRLSAITGVSDLRVNSAHRQAVAELGEGLLVSAREDNGVIQAIEDPQRAFWLGVQFHPEFLFYCSPVRRLFHAFVAAAADYAATAGAACLAVSLAGGQQARRRR